MNLNAYDNIKEKINKTKTWTDIKRKLLISREIKYRPYYSLLKRYDVQKNVVSYFIAMLDKPPLDKVSYNTMTDDYGRIKLNVSSIWDETYLNKLETNCNICCNLVETEYDGDIYLIDI